jgi:hypothetical protein
MMIISILASFFVISATSSKFTQTIIDAAVKNWGTPELDSTSEEPSQSNASSIASTISSVPDASDSLLPPGGPGVDQNTNLYGAEYEKHHAYNASYTDCYTKPQPVIVESPAERDTSLDGRNCLIAQRRARDKKCMDGYISKNSDYYKYFYADELSDTENRPWWGRVDT